MKIKTKKKMYIGGLLEHVRKNKLRGRYFRVMGESRYIKVTLDGDIYFDADFRFKPDDTFTVTVEEIVTPTTRFDELTEYIYDSNDDHHFTAEHKGANISMIIDCETHQFKTQAIYCKDTLVWTKEHGIPESGVLEVEG